MHEAEFIKLAHELYEKISDIQRLLVENYIDDFLKIDALKMNRIEMQANEKPEDQ